MYLCIDTRMFNSSGFPHSEIHGSINICFSPWLIAAYHVFLRLLVPRHSPYALTSLTYSLKLSILRFLNFHAVLLILLVTFTLYIFQCAI